MKKITLLIVLTVGVMVNSFAQKAISVNYTDEKVKALAEEVYKNEAQYLTQGHLVSYKEFLKRVEIIEATEDQLKYGGFPLISTLTLKDKYNSELNYDKGPDFDINKFNPLKYFFITDKSGESTYYRIYGTKYMVKLLPNK